MNAELGPPCITEESFEQLVLDYQMPLKRMCYMYLHTGLMLMRTRAAGWTLGSPSAPSG